MEVDNRSLINNRQKMKVNSLSLDRDEFRRLCDILQERANAASEIEVGLYPRGDSTQEEHDANLDVLRSGFELKITVSGTGGEELWGTIDDVFGSANFPEQVGSFYVDSGTTLKAVHQYSVQNFFTIFLDFTKPKIFDFSLLPNLGTLNESNIEVRGYDATWVNGVFSELKKFIDEKSSALSVVHKHSIYDIFLWILGFPISFWVCFIFSDNIETAFSQTNIFAINALYLYAFIASLFLFRILFHYLRWVCPLVEFRTNSNLILVHRAFLAVIIIGWVGQFGYDMGKWAIGM